MRRRCTAVHAMPVVCMLMQVQVRGKEEILRNEELGTGGKNKVRKEKQKEREVSVRNQPEEVAWPRPLREIP